MFSKSKSSSNVASCLKTGGISSLNLYPNALNILISAKISTGKLSTKKNFAFKMVRLFVGNANHTVYFGLIIFEPAVKMREFILL